MRLQDEREHPHGLSDHEFDALFTTRPAGDLRLPRLPVAHPPADLPARQPPQPPRPRLQGGGHDDDAVRHGHAQRHGPLPPRDRRHRPRAGARRRGRPDCASTWPTSACATARTPASTATTPRRCATGPGRGLSGAACVRVLVVNAGSSSLKLRLLGAGDAPKAVRPERRATGRRSTPRSRSCRGADAVGHRVVHGGTRFLAPVRVDDGVVAACASSPSSPRCTSPRRWTAWRRVGRALPDVPAVACFDTAFHATLPAAARDLRAAARVARALRPAALRLPRPLARLRVAARGRGARGSCRATSAPAPRWRPCATGAASTRRWASRRWRGSSWPPARAPSTRGSCSGSCATALDADAARARAGPRGRASSASPATPTCAPSWLATTPTRGWPSTSTSTACARRSRPWPPPSVASTRSSSRAASASTHPRSGARPPAASASSAWRSTRPPMPAPPPTPTSARPAPPSARSSSPRARTSRSPARSAGSWLGTRSDRHVHEAPGPVGSLARRRPAAPSVERSSMPLVMPRCSVQTTGWFSATASR